MHGIYKTFQLNFHVLPFKKPSKYFSFCDTVFSSWGRSGRICYLPYCYISKKRGKRKRKKGTPPWYVKVGGHPMESVSRGLRKEKWGGVPSFIKKQKCANLSQNLLSMEDSKNPIACNIPILGKEL
jgi:hypothetical protein